MKFLFPTLLLLANLVSALDFSTATWNLGTYEGAGASYDSQNGIVSISNPGSDYWHVQLTRTGFPLEQGKTYRASFTIQSLSGVSRGVEVRIGRNGSPYEAFGEFGALSATTAGRTLERDFVMKSASTSDTRFEFNVGKNAGKTVSEFLCKLQSGIV
jgi:VCBS repeat-containing protein